MPAGKKKGPKQLVVVLLPFFIYDGNVFETAHRTGHRTLDRLVDKRIAHDQTHIRDIFAYDNYTVVEYAYDGRAIYVTLEKNNGGRFTDGDCRHIRDDIVDPHNVGPDTWMEGDIQILGGGELQRYRGHRYEGQEVLELGVEVVKCQAANGRKK